MTADEYWASYKAWLLSYEYNFCPIDPLKFEPIPPTGDIGTHFFANISNTVICHIQYDNNELELP